MECRTGDLKDGHAVQDWRYSTVELCRTGDLKDGRALQDWRYSTVELCGLEI